MAWNWGAVGASSNMVAVMGVAFRGGSKLYNAKAVPKGKDCRIRLIWYLQRRKLACFTWFRAGFPALSRLVALKGEDEVSKKV